MPFRVLPARLALYLIFLHSLRCYALNCIHIWGAKASKGVYNNAV